MHTTAIGKHSAQSTPITPGYKKFQNISYKDPGLINFNKKKFTELGLLEIFLFIATDANDFRIRKIFLLKVFLQYNKPQSYFNNIYKIKIEEALDQLSATNLINKNLANYQEILNMQKSIDEFAINGYMQGYMQTLSGALQSIKAGIEYLVNDIGNMFIYNVLLDHIQRLTALNYKEYIITNELTYHRESGVKNVEHGVKDYISYNNGNRFEGYMEDIEHTDNKLTFKGKGILIYQNGDKYEGEFAGSMPVNGKLTCKNGDTYFGQFANGLFDGQGSFVSKNMESKFFGTYKNGRVSHGVLSSPTRTYIGGFKDDRYYGTATIKYHDERKKELIAFFDNGEICTDLYGTIFYNGRLTYHGALTSAGNPAEKNGIFYYDDGKVSII